MNKRLIIIANRLPLKVTQINPVEFQETEGGLATGLNSLETQYEKHWIGWPGVFARNGKERSSISESLEEKNIHPVFLSRQQVEHFYEGYCNGTLWPLFHYFYVYTVYNEKYYSVYQEVNRLFLEKVLEVAGEGDILWIHDYHLLILPGMIREKWKDASIGFFLHIPFPSYELFRFLPERKEILRGLLGADLIGFHTYDYMRHFMSTVYRILGYEYKLNEMIIDSRVVRIDSFPMGIKFEKFYHSSENEKVISYIKEFRSTYGNQKFILSVDRLDYSKGILNRLEGFELFLEQNPEYRGKISLLIIVVPSRTNVEQYRKLKNRIDQLIGKINGKYSTIDWMPIIYFFRGFDFEQLCAIYYISEIALVTPLRDGMNLIAKEFIAAKKDTPGVLILSEMAGSSIELKSSIIINPNNVNEIANAILAACRMTDQEKLDHIRRLQQKVRIQTVEKWANDFISELADVTEGNLKIKQKEINQEQANKILDIYIKSKQRLIILDYDGTLVPFNADPQMAIPSDKLLKTIKNLVEDPSNTIIINSGRKKDFLDKHFSEPEVIIISEHGSYLRINGRWENFLKQDSEPGWKDEILPVLHLITDKTPGSMIEEKESGLVWHYRNTDKWLAELRETQLMNMLVYHCTKNNLSLMKGNKVIEIKVSGSNKGIAITRFIEMKKW
ncbi:MAG TPA: bifunctional alpha,alpha-trehalose-phosphate synthase (UDP-forming)/trehalose-phosphatase, partial [Bacteroidales bacterium]|nr:bifunctional alpha,alpha-trehalose-phosphate synthase (UDP-forming)/trehalose-phosphatase [Bacteroidales bacterium]